MVERLRNSEANAKRIANVEAAFGWNGASFLTPGRVLVGEGVLIKMCSIIISKKRYNKQHIIPLEEVKLESLEDDGYFKYGWLIKTKTKSFAVYAENENEKREWMLHMKRCIQDLLKIGRTAPSEYAAVWIPDGEASKCMCCKSVHFSVIQRKHHCRACGNVVCRSCSSKNFLLNDISKKPVRVCDICYNKLCQGIKTDTNITNNNLTENNNNNNNNNNDDNINNNDSSDNSDEEFNHSFEAPKFYGANTTTTSSNSYLND